MRNLNVKYYISKQLKYILNVIRHILSLKIQLNNFIYLYKENKIKKKEKGKKGQQKNQEKMIRERIKKRKKLKKEKNSKLRFKIKTIKHIHENR